MSKDDLSDFVTTTPAKKSAGRQGSAPIIHGIAWCVCLGLLFFVVPKFESIFKDFGIDLPWLTKVLVKASHLMVKFGVVLVPLFVVMMFVDGQILARLSRNGDVGKSLAWSVVMLAVPLVVLVLVLVGLVLPLTTIMTRLSG
jgi:hypothetical protein